MIRQINKINNFLSSKSMAVLDYLGAFALLAWAGYEYNAGMESETDYRYILGFGIVALIFAIIKPAKLINKDAYKEKKK